MNISHPSCPIACQSFASPWYKVSLIFFHSFNNSLYWVFCKHHCARCWWCKGEQNASPNLRGKTDMWANNSSMISMCFVLGCYGNTLARPLPRSGKEVVRGGFRRRWCLGSGRWLGASLGIGGKKEEKEPEGEVHSSDGFSQRLRREETHSRTGEMQAVWYCWSIKCKTGGLGIKQVMKGI